MCAVAHRIALACLRRRQRNRHGFPVIPLDTADNDAATG